MTEKEFKKVYGPSHCLLYRKRFNSDMDSVIKNELEKFARELFKIGKLRSGQNKKIAALKRVESYLNQKP